MNGKARLLVVSYGPPARGALWDLVDAAKSGDPLSPVTVATPSPLANLALRRGFGESGRPGFANVRFSSLSRVAELLGEPALAAAGRRPLTGSLRAHAVRTALDSRPGPLARVRHHATTVRALERSLLDLRRAEADDRDRVARQSERAAAIVALADHCTTLTSAYFDDDDLLDAAAAVVEARATGSPPEAAALADVGTLILYLPTRLSSAEERLFAALARAGPATAVVGLTGDNTADLQAREIATRLESHLGAAEEHPAAAVAHATRLLHAGDPDDEVRAVVRQIVGLAATLPLHRIAVLYRQATPYMRLVQAALDAASVTWNGPSGRRLADCTAGRVLLGLLSLCAGDFDRDAVIDWLTSGPMRDPADGRGVHAHRFDRLSREAGIVRGLDQWTDRLALLTQDRHSQLADRRDIGPGHRRRLEADIDDASRITAFVATLHDRLTPPAPATWPAFARWAHDLLDTYLGTEAAHASWPAVEIDAARRVMEIVDGTASLAEIDGTVDTDRFTRAVERELDAPAARHGKFGAGVFAGPIGRAAAADFDTSFVLGLTEGSFPPRGQEDPLLPDRERAAAGDALPQQAHRRSEERRTFLAALAGAGESVLTFPRADPRGQRPQLPARWLLESASALAGETMGATDLLEHAACDWLTVIESFESGTLGSARSSGDLAGPEEYDLRWMRLWQKAGKPIASHPLLAGDSGLAAGLASSGARISRSLTVFDGLVGPRPELAPSGDRPVSPTALQYWASCPRRYLFEKVLRVREVDRPEEITTIAPTERGTLLHKILEKFVEAHRPTDPAYRWTDADRAELTEVTRAMCDDAESRGVTGIPLLWKLERRRIERIALAFLATDDAVRSRHRVVPLGFEKVFGIDDRPPATIDLAGGRKLAFKGRIDRVDQSPDGRHVVIFDYKTGRGMRYSRLPDDPVDGGRLLQLPVYALAIERDHPGAEIDSYYWFLERQQSKALVGYKVDSDHRLRFVEVVGAILDGISAGVFPAAGRPSKMDNELEGCNICFCKPACPPGRARTWSRKQGDPAAARYLALDEPTRPDPDDPGEGA